MFKRFKTRLERLAKSIPKNISRNSGSAVSDVSPEVPRSGDGLVQRFLSNTSFIKVGVVTDASAGMYTVEATAGEGGAWPAVYLPSITHTIDGGGDLALPVAGDRVLCVVLPNSPVFILGTIEESGAHGPPTQFPIIGTEVDAFTSRADTSQYTGEHILNGSKNQGRPYDAIPGDWGHSTAEGLVVALLKGGLALLKASETCQISFSTIDSLMRVIARNQEVFTDLGESSLLNDEGEVSLEINGTGHFAESLGQVTVGTPTGQIASKPEIGKPVFRQDDPLATGNWRHRILIGYLGGVLKAWVTQPSEEPTALPEGDIAGVAELFITEEGALRVATTKEVVIRKTSRIRVPRKQRERDDPEGDSLDAEYIPTRDAEEFKWSTEHIGGRGLQTYDGIAVNQAFDLRRILDHVKDWKLSEPVEPRKVVSPETKEVEYVDAESVFTLRNDGGVYVESSSKCSIELSPTGSLTFNAPQDIIFQAGRDIVGLAGSDMVMRGKRSADLIATEGDLHLKAEGKARVFARTKGILLHTKGNWDEEGGLVLKSENAPIALKTAKEIRLNAGKNLVATSGEELKLSAVGDLSLASNASVLCKADRNLELKIAQNYKLGARQVEMKGSNRLNLDAPTLQLKCNSGAWEGASDDAIKISHKHMFSAHGIDHETSPITATAADVNPPEAPKSAPFTEPAVDSIEPNIVFSFRLSYSIASDKTYDGAWQSDGSGSWDLTSDQERGTAPWPGLGYSNRYAYKDGKFTEGSSKYGL